MGEKIDKVLNVIGRYNMIIKYLIAFIVILLLVNHVQSKEDLLPVLYGFQYNKLLPAFILLALHIGSLLLLWVVIVRNAYRVNMPFKLLFHSFFGGRTLGFITPGQLGDLLKGMFFISGKRLEGTSVSILFSIYNSLIRIFIGIFAYIYIYRKYSISNFNNNFLMITCVLTIVLLVILYIFFFNNHLFKSKIELISILKKQIINTSASYFLLFIILAIIANLLSGLAFLTVLSGFDNNKIDLDGFMAFEAALFSLALFPITPSGMGFREGFRVYFFSIIGCNSAAVLSASLIVFSLNIVLPALIGLSSLKYLLNNLDS
tara:strand:- start:2113 stop:3066 length:954 start_codon:yes stop_codon:yes gene_type:complete